MGARLIQHLAPSNCRCRSSFRHWIFRRSLQECYTGGVPLWSKVSKVPKVPSLFPFIPRLFHLGTFGTSLLLLLVEYLIMWSRELISKLLQQEMGRGWEWAGDIGEKGMQILVAVRRDLCSPMPFHSAKSVKSSKSTIAWILTFWYFW